MQANAATRANQRQRFQQHMAPIKVRVHPAVAILLAVGKGLTKKKAKDEPPKKKCIPDRKGWNAHVSM